MEVRTVSSTFPEAINQVILELLSLTDDSVEIRDRLKSLYNELWIVVKGKKFSYMVSRANKSAGVYLNKRKNIRFLIYNPPFTEVPQFPGISPAVKSNWRIIPVKKTTTEENSVINDLYSYLMEVEYQDTSKACEIIKVKANSLEEGFWHVFVGSDFVCTLPSGEMEYLIYVKAKKDKEVLDVVVFRQKGLQKQVNWYGMVELTVYMILTFMFFIGIIGFIKCDRSSGTLLCTSYQPCLYLGIAFVFSKSVKNIMKKLKKS